MKIKPILTIKGWTKINKSSGDKLQYRNIIVFRLSWLETVMIKNETGTLCKIYKKKKKRWSLDANKTDVNKEDAEQRSDNIQCEKDESTIWICEAWQSV